jgi:hypothetical protein
MSFLRTASKIRVNEIVLVKALTHSIFRPTTRYNYLYHARAPGLSAAVPALHQ